MEHELALIMDAMSLNALDLPSNAGQLFDYFKTNPNNFRLLSWGRMEATSPVKLNEASRKIIQRKLDEIKLAEDEGYIEAT